MIIVTTLLVAGSIIGIDEYVSRSETNKTAMEAVDTNMRVAWNELKQVGKTFRIEDGKLSAGETVLNDLNEVPDSIVEQVGGNATIFMNDVRIATNVKQADGSRAIGTKLAKSKAYEAVFSGNKFRGVVDILGQPYITGYDPIKDDTGNVVGILFVGIPKAQFFATMEKSLRWAVSSGAIIGIVVILIMALVAQRTISRPIKDLTNAMEALAKGDNDVELPEPTRDEIGDMARALQVFKENAAEMERLRIEQEKQKERSKEAQRAAMLQLANTFEANVRGVVSTVSAAAVEMQSSAKSMSSIAEGTSEQSAAVASAAQQSAANLSTVAAAAEELNSSIGEISRQIKDSVAVAATSVKEAEATSEVMNGLSHAANDIGNVVKLIEGIASQVNLLALNATIEAARAGDAGKGFAVVANEVKNLANQVAVAAQDITRQVSGIQEQTGTAVRTIDGITTTIRRISEISTAIEAAVGEQGGATKEISRSIQETAEGTASVTRNIESVKNSASETGNASGQVLATAAQLAEEAQKLQNVVDEFVARIRDEKVA
jgi:methyl-accepting chemotaxis protein